MKTHNIEVAERWTKAVYAGDQQTLHALAGADFVLNQAHAHAYGGVYLGVDGFLQFLGAFVKTYEVESLAQTRTYVTEDPNVLVFEFAFRGTQLSTKQKFDTTLLERWTFRDGKISSITPHWFEIP